jgi:hypothetical protein
MNLYHGFRLFFFQPPKKAQDQERRKRRRRFRRMENSHLPAEGVTVFSEAQKTVPTQRQPRS